MEGKCLPVKSTWQAPSAAHLSLRDVDAAQAYDLRVRTLSATAAST